MKLFEINFSTFKNLIFYKQHKNIIQYYRFVNKIKTNLQLSPVLLIHQNLE